MPALLQPECIRNVLTFIPSPEVAIRLLRSLPSECLDEALASLLKLAYVLELNDLWPVLHVRKITHPSTMERIHCALSLYKDAHVYDPRALVELASAPTIRIILHTSNESGWMTSFQENSVMDCITALNMNASQLSTNSLNQIIMPVELCSSLVEINLQLTSAQNSAVKDVIERLPNCSNLVDVKISKMDKSEALMLEEHSVKQLVTWINSRNVKKFHFTSIDTEVLADTVAAALLCSSSIESIALNKANHLAQALLELTSSWPPHLTNLELNTNRLTIDPTIFDSLEGSTLRHFDINSTYLGLLGVEILAAKLTNMPNLTSLNLSSIMSNHVRMDAAYLQTDHECCKQVAQALTFMNNLVVLELARNRIQDADIEILVQALPQTLEVLDLSSNHIRNAGVYSLSGMAECLPNLRVLRLKGNAFGNEGARIFGKGLWLWRSLEELSFLGREMDMYGIILMLRALCRCQQPVVRLDVGGPFTRKMFDDKKISQEANQLNLIDNKPIFITCPRSQTTVPIK
ncbi:hypothetical protein THRCLA_07838 [Thraustotheca clavata]|uniref:Uncharacterized protein n=1 Tax=Thraustotheca clavata TaxID=74557 RepID=A0A1V9ZBV9_9STRA|nr:hypothetical protein THRCLA_07838 [Thraustotheca clavata]